MMDSVLNDKTSSTSTAPSGGDGQESTANWGSVRNEFKALISGCGVYALDQRAKIALTGNDRSRWLNGMVTNNVRDLSVGHGLYAFMLNPQGRIQGDLYIYNHDDSLLLDTDHSQLEKLLTIFDHYIIMDEVEVTNRSASLTAIGVAGPKARALLQSVGITFADVTDLEFVHTDWQGKPVILIRRNGGRGDFAFESYELWVSPNETNTLWDALVKAGAVRVGATALEQWRIAMGIPRYGQDIREKDLPQETGQEQALNFSKGCYVGQEIVERIRSRGAVHRQFNGFEVRGLLPAAGVKIQADGKDVGEITSSASLPLGEGEYPVALGYVRREFAVPSAQLQAGEARLIFASLPFSQIFK